MRISDWSSDVCSSDLHGGRDRGFGIRDSGNRCRACPNPQFPIPNPGCYGFTNRSVIRSLSPIAWYLASSASSWLLLGGSVHTPLGWSLVSFGLALASLVASRVKPARSEEHTSEL